MKNNWKSIMLAAVMVVVLALSACGGADKSGFPTGKFVNPNDVDGGGFEFKDDGTWIAFNKYFTQARGQYTVEGDIYTEVTNNGDCPAPMDYKFSFDGSTLTFELTEGSQNDTCEARKLAFDGVTYVLEK
jgi:hypothetical protein